MPGPHRIKQIPGSICAPLGFKAAAIFCDIKKLGTGKGSEKGPKRDLALIVSDVPAAVAGMFTCNQVCAAPVRLSAKRTAKKFARAIVANSGNANACTGIQGMRDAETMARRTAEAVAALYLSRRRYAKADESRKNSSDPECFRGRYKIAPEDVLVCSTGRIGVPMPMKNVERGIRKCAPLLARSTKSARDVAEAIMTSDTRRKEIAVEFKIGKSTIRIGGVCKGAGMIQPGMVLARSVATGLRPVQTAMRGGGTAHSAVATKHATMLAFITTDVAIEPDILKRALETAVVQSFNRITVDGDMSTNDSVIALANGSAGNPKFGIRLRPGSPTGWKRHSPPAWKPYRLEAAFVIFQTALTHVCLELAKMIVRDGEGVTRFVTLHVSGARSSRDAEDAARAIANSSLVKTSWCGGDPNWGRVLCALGYSSAKINESMVDIGYSRPGDRAILGFRRGKPTNVPFHKLAQITSAPEFDVHVDLHLGRSEFVLYASDLTENYVAFNKGDVNDPTTLGG
jgi:glutamate N-acetyltransferase/amino-acid N-acetyltransferase